MKIRLRKTPQYNGTLYGIDFIEGVSTIDVPPYLFERFNIVLGLEPEYLPETDKDVIIAKLQQELVELKKAKKSKNNEA